MLTGVDIYWTRSRHAADDALLSPDERERASRYCFSRDRDLFVTARATLRRILASRVHRAPEALRFEYSATGKPSLAGWPELKFNVSHSGGLAVFAVCRGREVGIDVEEVRAVDGLSDMIGRVCTPLERNWLASLSRAERLHGFFRCWTVKEACAKGIGMGLRYPLDQIETSAWPNPLVQVRAGSFGRASWRVKTFAPAPGFVCAAAVDSGGGEAPSDGSSGCQLIADGLAEYAR